jgi:hypothetical protein
MSSTARAYFENLYANSEDPWAFATSEYERRKYAVTMASLPRPRYGSAFEPGCSVGVLSELLATDIVEGALTHAARRLKNLRHVRVERRAIPAQWPREIFDLVIVSEVAYYFDDDDLTRVMSEITESTSPGAHVVAVHWRGETDYPLTGDDAHELMGATRLLRPLIHHVEEHFLLDVWERTT